MYFITQMFFTDKWPIFRNESVVVVFFSLQKTFLAYAYLRLENKRWNSKSALTYIGCSCLSVHNIRPKESKLIKILTVNEAYIASYPQVFEMQSSFGNKSQEKRRLSLFSSVYNHHQPPPPNIHTHFAYNFPMKRKTKALCIYSYIWGKLACVRLFSQNICLA